MSMTVDVEYVVLGPERQSAFCIVVRVGVSPSPVAAAHGSGRYW
jgi:hypothetical protein